MQIMKQQVLLHCTSCLLVEMKHLFSFVCKFGVWFYFSSCTNSLQCACSWHTNKYVGRLKYAALSFSSSSGEGSNSGDIGVDYRAPCIRPGDRSPGPAGTDIEMNLISMTPTGLWKNYNFIVLVTEVTILQW